MRKVKTGENGFDRCWDVETWVWLPSSVMGKLQAEAFSG